MENNFKILAGSFCIGQTNSDEYKVLLDETRSYLIPIFQRPYSWRDEIISKFINDIFNSYQTIEGEVISESMFIGTMQVSKPIDGVYEVIDGQQRLTTLLLLLKVLGHYKNDIRFNWLNTEVNNGEQQKSLEKALSLCIDKISDEDCQNNLYATNLRLIDTLFKELLEKDPGENSGFDISDFINHLYSNVFFVVIETHAGLSKTLQIFDTINTTGLDLNGGDIFKIRMYEYLTSVKKMDKDVFKDISRLYEKIESKNKELKTRISISHILHLYQYSLIAEYDLPNTLYSYNSTTFFERFFETIFKIKDWSNFSKANDVNLSLKKIEQLIDSRFEWQQINSPNISVGAAHYFIGWSRYSKYWILRVLFYHNFKDQDLDRVHLHRFTVLLSKVFQLFSIRYQKSINEIHRFSYGLNKSINSKDLEKTFERLLSKLESKKNDKEFIRLINFDLIENRKRKDNITRIAALLHEENSHDAVLNGNILKRLFMSDVDIEHVQSYNDENKVDRFEIQKHWGRELNGLGNLVILERDINRSISNKNFVEKIKGYKKSKFPIILNEFSNRESWTKEDAISRREEMSGKILKYFFESYS